MIKFLGLDVGETRIGVSIANSVVKIANSYEVIDRTKIKALHRIKDIIREENINILVIGLPLKKDGSSSIQVNKIESFTKKLINFVGCIKYYYFDERYSTKGAEYYLNNFSKKNHKEKRAVVDMIAASIILQNFLDKNKEKLDTLL